MAETVSDSDVQPMKPPPKRRRILDPSAIVPVPVYSSKVSSSLQLKPMAPVFTEKEDKDDAADDSLWSQFSSRGTTAAVVALSDSEEDEAEHVENKAEHDKLETIRCPSPPPPESPVQKQSRQVKKKISEIDRRLRAVNSLLSPEHQNRTRSRRHRGPPSPTLEEEQDDDVIILTPNPGPQSSPYSSLVREIPLKIRCRTDVHKIPVLSSTPLSDVLAQLSVILKVPPPRLLLLREEVELPTDATVSELGLGIADIIECVVMAAEDKSEADDGGSIITVRLQSKDRDSSQEFSLHRDAPLGSIFSQYLSRMSPSAQRKVRFHFDGSKVADSQTPAQLDMEDGDIVEVWI
ncbi:NFATC2-interacting protein isoform X1 [Seriola lalandi dorsalis]|uniref:NFATC2-interacting protein isoform X1 n=2 Tax=Seriola lalandi dorsalis TaxID=1841481 RepID=UPI000C6F9E05|nr:NFATC2-interacting protein isoform X1 [Seriola lalandi dorsalis]